MFELREVLPVRSVNGAMAERSRRANPLAGRSVVVVRSAEQAGTLADRLRVLGASVIVVPVITIADASDGGAALREAAARVGEYDWVVLTSVNAARRWLEVCPRPWPPRLRVAAVGPGTADALGGAVDLMPERNVGEGLVDAFPAGDGRVLVPRAAVAREVVPEGLRTRGWHVDVVEAYRTVPVRPSTGLLAAAAAADAIAFTSGSTVRNYVEAAGVERVPRVVVCIGTETAGTAVSVGLTVDAVADPHTLDGLVEAVKGALARE